MITLKELVEMQRFNQKTDTEIIIDYYVLNDLESEGINLMNILAKEKCDKLSDELNKVKGSLSMYAGSSILYGKFGKETGGRLDHIIILFILGYDIEKDYPTHFQWLKETIPTLKCPKVFWREFYEWLISKGIYFLGENK
jgi:hypothetical protein